MKRDSSKMLVMMTAMMMLKGLLKRKHRDKPRWLRNKPPKKLLNKRLKLALKRKGAGKKKNAERRRPPKGRNK